jgi:hypothetical protein
MRVTAVHLEKFGDLIGTNHTASFASPPGDYRWLLISSEQDPHGWLVVGNIMSHGTLFLMARLFEHQPHDRKEMRKEFFTSLAKAPEAERQIAPRILGGGFCDAKGLVNEDTGWVTVTFKVLIPEEYKILVRAKLAEYVPHCFHEEETLGISAK